MWLKESTGAWSGLDSRRLHAHLAAAQSVYHARLRLELGERMGATWEVRPSGTGEVVGVDHGLRRLFSTRSTSMEEYRHRRAGPSVRPTPTAAAFHADRPEKDRTITVDHLIDGWRRRASDLGFDLGDLTRAVGARPLRPEVVVDVDRLRARLEEMGRARRWVGPHHLVAAVAASAPAGGSGCNVEAVAARLADECGGEGRSPNGRSSTSGALGARWDPAAVIGLVEGGRLPWSGAGHEGLERPAGHRRRPGIDWDLEGRAVPTRPTRSLDRVRRRDGIGW